jgi:hypothetical protein
MFLALIVFVSIIAGCKKDSAQSGADLYGTWIKGNQAGDTLQFLQKNGKDILRRNESFNQGIPAYTEKEYRFRNGKLAVKLFSPFSDDFYPMDSFRWTSAGREFSIQGIQLYMYMASTNIYFTYRKI